MAFWPSFPPTEGKRARGLLYNTGNPHTIPAVSKRAICRRNISGLCFFACCGTQVKTSVRVVLGVFDLSRRILWLHKYSFG